MHEDYLTTTPSGGAFGIRSIHEDRDGSFWISNTRHRFRIAGEPLDADGYSILVYEARAGLPDAASNADKDFNYVLDMAVGNAGALWLACADGVWKYDGEVVTRFVLGEDAYAFKILCDDSGMLWVGTLEQGLFRFNGDTFESFMAQ